MTSPAQISDQDFELLNAYIDDQLAPSARAELERQLAVEPGLRVALDELQQTVRVLKATPRVVLPRNFTLDPVRFGRRVPWWARSGAMQLTGAIGAVASVALIVLGLVLTPLQSSAPGAVAFYATSQGVAAGALAVVSATPSTQSENQVANPTTTVLKSAGTASATEAASQPLLQATTQATLEETVAPAASNNRAADSAAAQSSVSGALASTPTDTSTPNFAAKATSLPTATQANAVADLNTNAPHPVAPTALSPQSAAAGPAPNVNSQPASGAPQNGGAAAAAGAASAGGGAQQFSTSQASAQTAQTDELSTGAAAGQVEATPTVVEPAPNVQQAQQPRQSLPSEIPSTQVAAANTQPLNTATSTGTPQVQFQKQFTPTAESGLSARSAVTTLPPTQTALPTETASSIPSEKPSITAIAAVPTAFDNTPTNRDFATEPTAPQVPILLIIGIGLLVFSLMLLALGWLRSRLSL